VRTISRNCPFASNGRHGDLSGIAQSVGDHRHHQAGACVGTGGSSANFAVAKRKDSARPGRRWEVERVPAELQPGRRQALPAPLVDFSPHPSDRKSTRLNSSHVKISYAVYCLKKKNKAIKL